MPTIVEEYYVEMAWDCRTCKTTNPGRNKVCSNCGKPLEREGFHDKDSRPTTINDSIEYQRLAADNEGQRSTRKAPEPEYQALLAKAKAGPDWECKFCGSHQQRGNGECATCGANEKFSNGKAAFSDETEPPYEEVRRETPPSAPSEEVVRQRQAEKKDKERRRQRSERRRSTLLFGGGAIGLGALIALIVWIFTPKYLDGKVSDVYYQHVAHVERNVTEYDSGFNPESGSFDVKEDGRKIHHHEKVQHGWDYPLVPETINDPPYCYITPVVKTDGNCVTQKNGFKKCQKITSGGDKKCDPRSHIEKKPKKTPHYDNEPVYQTWYTWKIHKWKWNRSIPVTGHTNDVLWPSEADIALNRGCSGDETERVHLDASYSITFANKSDTWKYTPSGLDEYQRLKLGSVHHLKIVAGFVTVLQ